MRRRADHAVVKRKPDAVLGGQMGIYDINAQLVRIAEGGEKLSCLCLGIVRSAEVYSVGASENINLLGVTQNCAIARFLFFF